MNLAAQTLIVRLNSALMAFVVIAQQPLNVKPLAIANMGHAQAANKVHNVQPITAVMEFV